MSTEVDRGSTVRTIVGYCWPWTVRPGETTRFMVSTDSHGESYRADLVRIICADNLPDPGQFKEREVQASFAGSYAGQHQEIHLGSYVEIAPQPALDDLGSFTVQAMVMPTLLPNGTRIRQGGGPISKEEPRIDEQHLISRWNRQEKRGWALIIDATGRPAFITGDGSKLHRTTLSAPLVQDQWFFVMASFDAAKGTVTLHARHESQFVKSHVGFADARAEALLDPAVPVVHEGPLRFAACTDGPGNGARLKPALCFNGRLDRVRLSADALNDAQAKELFGERIPKNPAAPIVGFWDFGKGIDSLIVHDLSDNRMDGITVNMPMRAVAGVAWDHTVTDWRQRPDHYSAIHFHDDDLYDAEWKSDFNFTVPEDLPNGIYAARLRNGSSEDYIPFFVAPARGTATAPVALLIPTATYTAYSNIPTFSGLLKRKRRVKTENGEEQIIEEEVASGILQDKAHAEFVAKNYRVMGKGLYSQHSDGTLCAFASQKHPNLTIRPKGIQWTLPADTWLVDWLEKEAFPYDVITDELLHEEGVELLRRYRVVITGNHPEYYSEAMMDAVAQYQELGGRLMYLGGNGFFWVTSFHEQLPGAIEVRKDVYSGHGPLYENFHAFDGIHGGRWERNGRPTQAFLGVGFSEGTGFVWGASGSYRRLPGSYDARAAFIFDGVRHENFGDYGILGGGAAGQELDCVSAECGTPPHALHLARADRFPSYVTMLDESYALNATTPLSDVVYFESSNGGAVFSAGSMCWIGSLSHNGYDNDVARITSNVLRRFMDSKPIIYELAE